MIHMITRPFNGKPQEILSNFDFTVCACAISPIAFHWHKDFFNDLETKSVRLISSKNVRLGIKRLKRYMDKGFKPDAQTFLKIINVEKDRASMYRASMYGTFK